MEWSKLYGKNDSPAFEDIGQFVSNELWEKLNSILQDKYHVQPRLSYSKCSMQRGWNVKYQKSGKSLCTLYPMKGFFIALVVIGSKETHEIELILPLLSSYTQNLYQNATFSAGGSWLMINVTEASILDDVLTLVQIRVKSK